MGRWGIWLVGLGVGVGATSACAQIIGLEPFGNGEAGSGASTGSAQPSSGGGGAGGDNPTAGGGGAGASCASGSLCQPAAPVGWKGPAAFTFSTSPKADCGSLTQIDDGHQGASADDCTGCTCEVTTACSATVGVCDATCGTCHDVNAAPSDCVELDTVTANLHASAEVNPAKCKASGVATGTLKFEKFVVVCALPAGDGCGGGQACLPKPPTGFAVCVYRDADGTDCPPDYPHGDRFDRQSKVSCDACACDPPDCAASTFSFYPANTSCGSNGVPATGSCVDTGIGAPGAFKYVPAGPGVCVPHAAAHVANTEPVTVCCR